MATTPPNQLLKEMEDPKEMLMIINSRTNINNIPGALPIEPATYDQEPSRTSVILSSHFTVDGVSPPLLQNPPPTLQFNPHFILSSNETRIITWYNNLKTQNLCPSKLFEFTLFELQNTLSLHDQEQCEIATYPLVACNDSFLESHQRP